MSKYRMSTATQFCPSMKGFLFLETTGMASAASRHWWVCRRWEQIISGGCQTALSMERLCEGHTDTWRFPQQDIIRKRMKTVEKGGVNKQSKEEGRSLWKQQKHPERRFKESSDLKQLKEGSKETFVYLCSLQPYSQQPKTGSNPAPITGWWLNKCNL